MRRIPTAASSLLLALFLCGLGQEEAELRARLRKLAAGDAPAAEAFDSLPVARLGDLHRLAASESPEVRAAVRALLPPASWMLSDLKTVGDVRARLRQFTEDLRKAEPEHRETRLEAARQLMLRGNESAGAEALKAYRERTHFEAVIGNVIAVLGTAEQTPLLLETLDAAGRHSYTVSQAIAAVGDARAEAPLLRRCEGNYEQLLHNMEALIAVGGDETRELLRKVGNESGSEELRWRWNTSAIARMRMRDPRLPAEFLAVSGSKRHLQRIVARGWMRLGDRSIVGDLAKRADDPKAKPEDRAEALEALAVLGNREHTPIFVKALETPALAGIAADALAELGDETAAAPLARAMKFSVAGNTFARALMYVPPKGIEKDLLEVLDDPRGHPLTFVYALPVASRHGGPAVRDKLIGLLMDMGPRLYDGYAVARALVPLMTATDLRKLSRSTSRDAPHENEDVRYARLAARAGLGDAAARKEFVDGCLSGLVRVRMDDHANPLKMYPGKPEDLLADVKAVLKTAPTWNHGIEYLIHLRPEEALALVPAAAAVQYSSNLMRGLAALLKGELPNPSMNSALERLPDAILEAVARAVPEATVDRMRRAVLEESLSWRSEGEVNEGGKKVKRTFYKMNLVGDMRLGMLAARRDPIMESVYRAWLRTPQQQGVPFTDRMTARALADLGAAYMFDTYARWLRAEAPEKRALAADCLARLGDKRAIPLLVPLLDDHERGSMATLNPMEALNSLPPLARRMCDDAADALEKLSGRKFPGDRATRIAAIKEWAAKTK